MLFAAANRYAQSSDIQTVKNNVQDDKTTRRKAMTSQMISKNRTSACDYSERERHSETSYLRDRLMPAVVIARNTPGTHNHSATDSVQ